MKEFIIPNSNNRIRYHDFPGEGTPILFIHGLGCAGSFDYPEVAAQPPLCGHRRIVVDLLGSGFSDRPGDFGFKVSDHAEYLKDFITHLGIGTFILYGHSLGGAVALALADLCRDRVQNIILGEANLDSGGGSTSKVIASYSEEEFLSRGFQSIVQKSRQSSDQTWAASFSISSPIAVYRISKSAVEGQTPSWREILYSLNCPKTFIFGERSLPDPDLQVLMDHGLHIEVVAEVGHSMGWENPAGLAQAIRNGILRG